MSDILFEPGDLFFEPVAAFFASWIGYCHGHVSQKCDVVSGRLRGLIIPQITFEDDPITGILQRQESIKRVRFRIDMSDPGPPKGNKITTSNLMEFWGQQMFGHAYESVSDVIQAKFGGDRRKTWPPMFQFTYHLRNGCFHGNTFEIRPGAISAHIATEWRGRAIDYSMNGQKVVGGFVQPADLVVLLHDMKDELK